MHKKCSYHQEVVLKLKSLAAFDIQEFGRLQTAAGVYPFFVVRVAGHAPDLPYIYIQAAIHGNEIAGIYAILDFLNGDLGQYKDFFNFIIVPLVNPFGFEHGTRTNEHGLDLNRNFKVENPEEEVRMLKALIENEGKSFLAVLDLHEDPTDEAAVGFEDEKSPTAMYMYEQYPADDFTFGRQVLEKLRTAGFEFWDGTIVFGEKCDRGLIHQFQTGIPVPLMQGSFDEYMGARSRYILILETPTCWDLKKRVQGHLEFLRTALEALKNRVGLIR